MLEPICYLLHPSQKKSDPHFVAERPEIILESARRLVPLGIDILKAEFPVDTNYETNQDKMYTYCQALSQITSGLP